MFLVCLSVGLRFLLIQYFKNEYSTYYPGSNISEVLHHNMFFCFGSTLVIN